MLRPSPESANFPGCVWICCSPTFSSRDVRDSAQQRLVALRIHLKLVGEQLDHSRERALLERLGLEVEEAIDELRDVARGVYPQVLADAGLAAALNAVAARSALPVSVRDQGLALRKRGRRRPSRSLVAPGSGSGGARSAASMGRRGAAERTGRGPA